MLVFKSLLSFLFLSSLASASTFVAQKESYTPANPSVGDTVTWNLGEPNEVTGLTFGTDAFTDVQSAINAVTSEDTVFIDEGDYIAGSTLFIEENLTLSGESPDTTRLLREATADPHSILRIGNDTVILSNLTVTGGDSPNETNTGGGIDCQGTDLTLNNCVITKNNSEAQKSGGGIGGVNFTLTVKESVISNNTCSGATDNGGGIGGRSATITVSNSAITNNTVTAATSGGGIGGNGQQITVTNSLITNNTANGRTSGGGVGGFNLTVTVNKSVISDNIANAPDSGGGFGGRNSGTTVNDSIVSNNISRGAGSGGGLGGSSSSITVNCCLISDNTAENNNSGGGVGGKTVNITVSNSTLSGNNATGSGSGGAIGGDDIQRVTVTNCTITANGASGASSGGGIGGLFNVSAAVVAANCIMAGNTAPDDSSDPDILAPLTDNGGNLIGILDGLTIADILLPLADNGGPTQTHALAPNSPALDGGLNANVPSEVTSDQRGVGFERIFNTTVDIGSFEFQPAPVIPPVVESITPIFEEGVLVQVDITYIGLNTESLYFLDRGTDLQSFPLEVNCVFPNASTFVISDFNPPSGPGAKAFYRLTESSGFLRK